MTLSAEERLCQNIDGYLAEELNEERKKEFESHLPRCDACSEQVEIERNLDLVLSRVPETVVIPANLNSVFSSHIRKERKKEFYFRGLLTVAVTVLLGFFSILVFKSNRPTENLETLHEDRITNHASSVEYKLYNPRKSVAKIKLKDPKKTIAVLYPTVNKKITMVFLYPDHSRSRTLRKKKKRNISRKKPFRF